MTPNVINQVAAFCKKNGLLAAKSAVVAGVSGGPDSLCLLHLLVALRPRFELTLVVAHLNHQLRGAASGADAAFVQQVAAEWQLPLYLESWDVATAAKWRKQSIEETARQMRYAFLWRVAEKTGATQIAVGHHADDQIETVLMHFLRGTGLAGLRGMLPVTPVTGRRWHPDDLPLPPASPALALQPAPAIIRPLLEITRREIETYCRENKLSPREDHTNQDTSFFRNRLRHELIPYLATYNPNIREILRRSAKVIAADAQFMHEQLEIIWPSVIKTESPEMITFHLEQWLKLPLAMKRSSLRKAVSNLRHGLRNIGFHHIEDAIAIVETGGTGAKATLPQGLVLTVSYQTFVIASEEAALNMVNSEFPMLQKGQVIPLNLPGVTLLPGTSWQISATIHLAVNIDLQRVRQASPWEAYLDTEVVGTQAALRTRQPGDTFCPLGMGGQHKKINEFMINEQIPVDRRPHIPLLATNKGILWVCGSRPDEQARIRAKTTQVFHLKFYKI